MDLSPYSKEVLARYIGTSHGIIDKKKLKHDLDNIAMDIELEHLQLQSQELIAKIKTFKLPQEQDAYHDNQKKLDACWAKMDDISNKRYPHRKKFETG